jgi:RsiW-degrading membrane proteinase PrsW (M82 family)
MRAVARSGSRARAVARTEVLLLGGLLAFVGLVAAVQELLGLGPVRLTPPLALALLVVPALLWLGYFYLQDRHEPEPKHFVLGIYLIGAFVAFPISRFLVELYPVEPWSGGRLTLLAVVAAIAPLGLAQELAKYLVVRYSIYLSDELDEPIDGIIYMTAAGIGFATAENLHALEAMGGTILLSAFAVNSVVTTLAHGSIAGVLGYAVGLARFAPAPRRAPLLLLGLACAATLNGLFGLLEVRVRVSGLQVVPWRGVAFAAVFAACVFGVTLALMRRHLAAAGGTRA